MKSLLILAVTLVALKALIAADETENTIVQSDRTFSKAEISIKPGEKLIFKNADGVAHNVFSTSKENPFIVKIQQPGEQTSVTFTNEGVAEVRCAIHPKMKLVVTVKK